MENEGTEKTQETALNVAAEKGAKTVVVQKWVLQCNAANGP
jgi:hypothetical protein